MKFVVFPRLRRAGGFAAWLFAITAFLAPAAVLAGGTGGADAPLTLKLATATPGGGFELFGNNAAAAVNELNSGVRIEATNTRGSVENITLLEQGAFDIGLVSGVPAYEAFKGIGRPASDLKIIAAMYSSPGMFVVKSGSTAQQVRDLVGKSIAWGTRSSGLTLMAGYIMDALGLDQNADFDARYLNKAAEGAPLLLKGEVAAFWGAGVGWPGFTKAMQSGGRFIGFQPDEVEKVTQRHSFLKAMTVPAGSYQGQDGDVQAIGVWAYVLARSDMPGDTAYRLAKALHEAQPSLEKKLAQARETTPKNTRAAAPEPGLIHPGVRRYLREIGVE